MSEVLEGSVEFISDGSFLSTSSVYLNEPKTLDTSLQMNSSLEEPVVRNLVLPQSDQINPTSILDSLENSDRGRMISSPPVISLDHGLDNEVDFRNDLVPPPPRWGDSGILTPRSPVPQTNSDYWSLEPLLDSGDRILENMSMSRTTNARGEQIVEVEINYDGNIEYPVNLPVQQIQKKEPVSINDEHNYATLFSQLQDDRWGCPSLISPKQGGVTVLESDLN